MAYQVQKVSDGLFIRRVAMVGEGMAVEPISDGVRELAERILVQVSRMLNDPAIERPNCFRPEEQFPQLGQLSVPEKLQIQAYLTNVNLKCEVRQSNLYSMRHYFYIVIYL